MGSSEQNFTFNSAIGGGSWGGQDALRPSSPPPRKQMVKMFKILLLPPALSVPPPSSTQRSFFPGAEMGSGSQFSFPLTPVTKAGGMRIPYLANCFPSALHTLPSLLHSSSTRAHTSLILETPFLRL